MKGLRKIFKFILKFLSVSRIFYFKKCGFVNKEDLWDQVQDFNWLKQEKSPNFDILND